MIIWVKEIKSCTEKSSWAHGCSLKIAKWPTKMGKPSLIYNMSLTRRKDGMRFFRSLWRHSNQNQIIEIDILIFFEGVPLLLYELVNVLCFCSFSKPFLICLPIVSMPSKRKSYKSVEFALWCGWYWWLIFLRLPFGYSHIYFKDTGYKKVQDTFIAIDCAIDYYPFWWEVPTKPLIRLFQKAKLRTQLNFHWVFKADYLTYYI